MIKPAEKNGAGKEKKLAEDFERYWRHVQFWGGRFIEQQELAKKPPGQAVVEAIPIFKEYATKTGGKTILDIGAGNGRHTFLLEREGFIVFPLDHSPRAIDLIKARIEREGITNVHPILGEANDIKYPEGTFDMAVNHRVLDLWKMDEIKKIVDEMRRVLKPGGIALISMASENSKFYTDNIGMEIEPGTLSYKDYTLHFFSEKEVKELFKNFNFISLEERLSTDNKNKFWVLTVEKK